jgi:Protein of unknown function (DUF1698)
MNTIIGTDGSIESMFALIGGWTSQFEVGGKPMGGMLRLDIDARLSWQIEVVDGIKGKRILELGPLEGAHTKMMIDAGAKNIIAIEGLSDAFLRCLIVKEAFDLNRAKFIFGDFCRLIPQYYPDIFDIVTALGVLYHQTNPARLIHDISRITDTVFVWSQVAGADHPSKIESSVDAVGNTYFGKIMNWGNARLTSENYCASLQTEAFWMYPAEMRRCFKDAGFVNITEKIQPANDNGDCLLFVASKNL